MGPGRPGVDCKPSRVLGEHIYEFFRSIDISNKKGDWTGCERQHLTHCRRMIERLSVLGNAERNLHGLVRIPQKPEYAGSESPPYLPLLETEADCVRRWSVTGVTLEHSLNMNFRVALIAKEMERNSNHLLSDKRVGRDGGLGGQGEIFFGPL